MRLVNLFLMMLLLSSTTLAYADDFAITTTAFLDAGILPVLYSCDGKDVSPEFAWTNPPAKTQSFVMILSDPDSPNGIYYHWIVYNIPASTTELTQGVTQLPAGALLGKNSKGNNGYNGPCPPKGSSHTYIFTLYALDTVLNLPAGADAKTVLNALKGHSLKQITMTAVYSRWLT